MKAVVIGGGIIGLSAALHLAEDGWNVTVLEKGDFADGCSFGNMGYLSPSHFVPLAAPGVVAQGLWWLLSAKSPFYIRPSLRPSLLRWGWRFLRASTEEHVARSARPLLDLLLLSKSLTTEWAKTMSFELTSVGCMMHFRTAKAEAAARHEAELGAELGLRVEVLDREQVAAHEPLLRPDVRGAVLYHDDAHLDPGALMRELQQRVRARGVTLVAHAEVERLEPRGDTLAAVHADERRYECDLVVLAAGAWSPKVAALVGETLPMMPGKGYSTTLRTSRALLKYPCFLTEARVALTPWHERLRIGSTMEIGPIDDRIMLGRVRGILEAVPRYFPAIVEDPAFSELAEPSTLERRLRETFWFGFRPVSHDGLPYIGWSKRHRNLLMATGHAMLGISMGAGTGKVVAELAGGRPTSVALEAFSPQRV